MGNGCTMNGNESAQPRIMQDDTKRFEATRKKAVLYTMNTDDDVSVYGVS